MELADKEDVMGLAKKYSNIIKEECGGMFALYPPNQAQSLGDYGSVADGRFTRVGNLSDLGLTLVSSSSSGSMSREFSSKGTTKMNVGANVTLAAGIVTAKPALSLTFASDFSVYFAVAGSLMRSLDLTEALQSEILARYRARTWQKDWHLVTTILEAGSMTVVISQSKNSQLVLEAVGEVPTIDMANVGLKLNATYDSSSSEKWVTEESTSGAPLTPFCWMHQVSKALFAQPEVVATRGALRHEPVLDCSFGSPKEGDWRVAAGRRDRD